jgi:iron complex outermembrane recepter protein
MRSIISHIVFLAVFLPVTLQTLYAQEKDSQARSNKLVAASISGTITDAQNGQPLAGASIYLSDLKTGAVSDGKGQYNIRNIPSGRHTLEISFVGYATLTEQIMVNGEEIRNFTLHTSILENNEVIVTGVSTATALRRSPAPVTLIRKQELTAAAVTNLVELMARRPGIAMVATGPAIGKPVIRGLGFNRVVVLNDGVRQEGQQWGDEHGLEVDEYSVQKIEILKGPASLVYGSDALAGVIQVITHSPVPQGTLRGSVSGQYQTNNRLRGWNAQLGGYAKNGFNWNGYLSGKAAADYSNRFDGRVYNSKFREWNGGAYAGWNGSWGYSHIVFSSYAQKAGIVEGERDDQGNFIKPLPGGLDAIPNRRDFLSATPSIPWQYIRHKRWISDNRFRTGSGNITLTLGFQQNRRMEYGNIDDPEERSLYFDLGTFTYTSGYHFKIADEWESSVGFNGMTQSNRNKGVETLIPEYRLFDLGAYFFTSRKMEKFTFSGGLRYDIRQLRSEAYEEGGQLKFEAFRRNFSNLSASAGISYLPNKAWVIKFNLARGFRAPSIAELASNGTHEGTNRYEYGTEQLQSETSWQSDLGMEWNSEHVSLSAAVFYNAINNYVFYQKLQAAGGGDSAVLVDGDYVTAFQFNQRNAVLFGAEFTGDWHPHPLDWLHFENSFSIVKGRFREALDNDRDIPFIPSARLVSQLRADIRTRAKSIRNASFSLGIEHSFAQESVFTVYDTETATPSYTLLNASLAMDIVRKSQTLCSLYVTAQNITNEAYQNHLNRLKYTMENKLTGRTGVFNMGRNFSVRLVIPVRAQLKG